MLHQRELADKKISDLLRDVAVQFNTIANQLMLLAKSNEDILGYQQDRLQPEIQKLFEKLSTDIKELINSVISFMETEGQRNLKELREAINNSCLLIQSRDENDVKHITNCQEANKGHKDILEAIQKMENERVKGRTLYTVIITAFIAAAGLVTTLVKTTECRAPENKTIIYKNIPQTQILPTKTTPSK